MWGIYISLGPVLVANCKPSLKYTVETLLAETKAIGGVSNNQSFGKKLILKTRLK